MFERLGYRFATTILLCDIAATLIALRASASLRLVLPFGRDIEVYQVALAWPIYVLVGAIWTVLFLLLAPHSRLLAQTLLEPIGRLAGAVALASLTFAGTLFLSFRELSRLQFIYFVALDLAVLLALHLVIRAFVLGRIPARSRRVLLVGEGEAGQQLAHELALRPWTGLQVVGYTSDTPTEHAVPHLGTLDATPQVVTEQRIDELIFTMPPAQQDRIVKLSLQLQEQPVMLHMAPSVLDLAFARTPVQTLGGIPLISLRESALTTTQRIAKRTFDVVASLALLVLCAPLFAIIALLTKRESPGPVFFWQERIGEYGRRFRMLKFRSMHADAEQRWQEVAQRDEQGVLIHKRTDDPRVTPLGRRLRRTSLDELPQLVNVLRGEMSLVGPRPEIPHIAAEYAPWQWQRFRVPPGMTGWWQVNGRSDKPMHLHTEDDLFYIQNYSFWLDLKILWMTIGTVWRGQGAY
jgi:exopolysaccharide biosynthesis polyprenyl glycosylphosphotransferase